MLKDELLLKVNHLLHKDYTYRTHFEDIEDLISLVEKQQNEFISLNQSIEEMSTTIYQYQLQETLLLERLKKAEENSRFQKYMSMAKENLKMAQKIAELEGELHGYRNQAELSKV
jgi:mannose/fructose/N-acetylgalactosamine-specific phosphotransferase system component IIB